MNFSINHVFLRIEGSQADEFLQGQITVDTNKVVEEEFIPSCVRIIVPIIFKLLACFLILCFNEDGFLILIQL